MPSLCIGVTKATMLPLNTLIPPGKSPDSSPAMVLGHRVTIKESDTIAQRTEAGTLEGVRFHQGNLFLP